MTFTSKDRTSNATHCIDGQIPVHTHSAPSAIARGFLLRGIIGYGKRS
jgi:hypothetical protein